MQSERAKNCKYELTWQDVANEGNIPGKDPGVTAWICIGPEKDSGSVAGV